MKRSKHPENAGLKTILMIVTALLLLAGCDGIGEDPPEARVGIDAQGNLILYADGEFYDLDHSRYGGTEYWDGITINLASTAAGGHSGSKSMEFEPVQAGGLGVFTNGIDFSQFQSMTLWVKAPTDNMTFGFGTGEGTNEVKVESQQITAGDEWQKITLPLGGKTATVKQSFWVYFGQQSGKLYIDDITFVKK